MNRSTLYYQSTSSIPDPEEIALCLLLGKLHIKYLCMGSRSLRDQVNRSDEVDIMVNRKRIQRLMRKMGIHSTAPKPNTSRPGKQHKIYPYLLKNLKVYKANQVWATDITYIQMARGFLYLVAIMDWYSRKVLSWLLSNSMDTTKEARESIFEWIRFYNHKRNHQALGRKTPEQVYLNSRAIKELDA